MPDELLNDPRITAMGLFSEAYGGLSAQFAAQLARHALDPVEFETLVRVARSPDGSLRMTDLATQIGLSTSGVTRVVDRLERDGLVRRQACPTDRRGSFAAITDAGVRRLEAVLPEHLALIDRSFTGLFAPEELQQVTGALRMIRDAVRPEAISGA